MKTIGIIGAMPSELIDIRKALPDSEIQKKPALTTISTQSVIHVSFTFAAVLPKSTQQSAHKR